MRRCLLFYKIQLLFRPSSLLQVSNELRSLKDKKQAKIPRLNQITFLARQRTNKCKYREYVPPLTRSPRTPHFEFYSNYKNGYINITEPNYTFKEPKELTIFDIISDCKGNKKFPLNCCMSISLFFHNELPKYIVIKENPKVS